MSDALPAVAVVIPFLDEAAARLHIARAATPCTKTRLQPAS